jgi:Fe-S-cluster containining protein
MAQTRNSSPLDEFLKIFYGFRDRLVSSYAAMDEAYADSAAAYGFECSGCEDSCCLTRFYHHTWAEFLFLVEGLKSVDREMARDVFEQARIADRMERESRNTGDPLRAMCPLNQDGLCRVYDFRPMICRLHGIPHELRKPGQDPVYGPGCKVFAGQCGHIPYVSFDRTPFYRELAALEQDVRKALGINEKIRMTIAQMVLQV